MITMYSADGDHIVVTHYCSAGNQPQMTSATLLGKPQKFSFSLVRVTGMKTEAEGHMVGLVLSIVDKDHLTQEWKYQANGKVSADLFQLKRKLEPPASIVAPGGRGRRFPRRRRGRGIRECRRGAGALRRADRALRGRRQPIRGGRDQ
jgi:hypothetical protein